MVQGYYNLEEAARVLGMPEDKLSLMAQHREIRAFADGRTWRFRVQDVEEMARRMGLGSNPDLPFAEEKGSKVSPPPGKGAPTPTPKGSSKPADEGVFDFSVAPPKDASDIDPEIVIESSASKKSGRGSGISPSPKPGSDSDVHLVFDVAEDITVANDSDVKVEDSGLRGPRSGARKTHMSPDPSKSGIRKKTMMAPGARSDSGVRLVPMEEDTVGLDPNTPAAASDSAVRLESPDTGGGKKGDASEKKGSDQDLALTTQEIDLDAELKKAAESGQSKKPKSKVRPKSDVKRGEHTPESPFELEAGPELPPKPVSPSAPTSLRQKPISGVRRETSTPEEEVNLGDLAEPSDLTSGVRLSGINLDKPADSGINLGKQDSRNDSLEFELSLEPESTPKPVEEAGEVDSSGEFELTLDEEGGLAPLEEDTPQGSDSGEKDIFETDFDMPALDEESGSEAVAIDEADTELESSDFDLSLGGEESGSQVVALEEGEADEGAATVAAPRSARRGGAAEDLEAGDLDDELLPEEAEGIETDEEDLRAVHPVAAAPANWGYVFPLMMIVPVAIMFLLSFMSLELLHGMAGYRQPVKPSTGLVRWFADTLGQPVPGD
jgi:excisionase family DNA binding protein